MNENSINNILENLSDWSGYDTDSDLENEDLGLENGNIASISENVQSTAKQSNGQHSEPIWVDVDEELQPQFIFNQMDEPVGINPDIIDSLSEVEETNRYAAELLISVVSPHSRLKKWENVTYTEMKTFLGIIMWMGLCPQPSIASYWKTNSIIYTSNMPQFMKRKRFELLLRTFHCCNNALCPPGDRLYKSMCIVESIIPFTGRLSFKQYIQNKAHKYGIKVFKLCINNFYTIGFKIYAGKEAMAGQRVSTKVVMEMAEDYLDLGRTMYTDNWYSSYDLASELLNRSTNLVGTLRSNRKCNPKDVVNKKLKKGEVFAKQCNKGITVLKWKDKRDVLMISTQHSDSQATILNKRGKEVKKPQVIIDYNKGKGLVDVTDLRNSYHNPLRRTLKWYKKIIFELLLNTSVLNALSLYEEIHQEKMDITVFREILVKSLLKTNEMNLSKSVQNTQYHELEKVKSRGRCFVCYKEMMLQGRTHAQKITRQVTTKCKICSKFFCMQCFFSEHKFV
ncbi:piggyBac transposable element-derived protein 4-like [Daktulosphaira vitifoliae]|uniref:piggyBac transposable element-derived protein 4-like n=1 Tax=Daktulosphaira vitifoliae TaxID=58002 RepID=UPI0021AAAC3F|nr:piggyBac transposable element-derived protein 4-like [Daktulosphaira vitifoliae]